MQTAMLKGSRLSLQQARLWSLQGRDQEVYCTQCAVLLEGQLQTATLQQALQQMVRQHKILRTTFYSLPGVDMPMQVVTSDTEFSYLQLSVADTTNLAV